MRIRTYFLRYHNKQFTSKHHKPNYRRSVGFLLAGLAGLFAELALLALLVDFFQISKIVSRTISLPTAITITFLINSHFKSKEAKKSFKALPIYLFVMLCTSLINFGIFAALTVYGTDKYFALIISSIIVAGLNFFLTLRIV